MKNRKERVDVTGGINLRADNPFDVLSPHGLKAAPERPPEMHVDKPRKAQTLVLRRLKAGKGGKVVTEISGFDMNPQQLEQLLKQLQNRLGTGGTRKGKVLELQGEKRAEVAAILEQEGYRVVGH